MPERPLSWSRIEELQAEALADDLDLFPEMITWTETDLLTYFELGGKYKPKLQREDDFDLDSAQSSADARTLVDEQCTHLLDDDHCYTTDDRKRDRKNSYQCLEINDDDRVEDAMLDAPMASVAVTETRSPLSSSSLNAESSAATLKLSSWSVHKLKEVLASAGVDTSKMINKSELVSAAMHLPGENVPLSNRVSDHSAKIARIERKAEDIKANGDRAFGAADYSKAHGHYTKAIDLFNEPSLEACSPLLLGTLYSNRSACLAHLKRFEESIEDGRRALDARPGWARAYCRVGFALYSLRRFEEARAVYEEGLEVNQGSQELNDGLAAILKERSFTSNECGDAGAHKERGNSCYGSGRYVEAIEAYTRAVSLAPNDESLYSNRSAAFTHLGNYREALIDGKRAIALRPGWGKPYSRCGFAALSDGDCESAYWFYVNGLRQEPKNSELIRGRGSALAALASAANARHTRRIARCRLDAERAPARIFAVSDVHYDHPGAREWAANLSTSAYQNDAIILAGDIGDTYHAVRLCLRAFKRVFRRVFYVPGNHDLWIRPKGQFSDEPSQFADSVAKLIALWQLCDDLEVDTGPCQLSPQAAVLPLDSWYSHLFDFHDPKPGSVRFDKYCSWPMGYTEAWRFMLSLNESRMTIPLQGDIISFSHFLPRQELPIPQMHEMAKGVGTVELDKQIRRAKSKLHIFGHTHINTSDEIQGVRYMQNAMGYGISPGQKLTVVHDGGKFREYMA